MKAWRVHQYGAPHQVLRLDDVDVPKPGAGELKIRVTSVTLNFNDLDGIHGRYKLPAALYAMEQRQTVGRTVVRLS